MAQRSVPRLLVSAVEVTVKVEADAGRVDAAVAMPSIKAIVSRLDAKVFKVIGCSGLEPGSHPTANPLSVIHENGWTSGVLSSAKTARARLARLAVSLL